MTLHLADGVALPDELAAQKNAILAMSGAGKSNTAVVLAEELHTAGIPWVAIDPKGDWWGIRAGRDGKQPGLPIPVLGGLHGDIPLEPTAGKLIGNLIADKRLTAVLDVSEFDTRQDQYRFLADLGETLLKANRAPLHLFLEEADEYLPQTSREKGNLPRCLGAWLRVVKRGRFRGLGTTLISQRAAAVNKDVLNQTDTLIAMRVTAPRDRKAVEEWVSAWTSKDELTEFMASLAMLEDGEAWVWSPQRLKLVQRVHVRRRATYDSGATPLVDERAAKAATLVDVDLDALKDEMADTIERAKADDPDELRAQLRERDGRIRELEHDLRTSKNAAPETIVERVEVPVLDDQVLAELHGFLSTIALHLEALEAVRGHVAVLLDQAEETVRAGVGAAQAPLPPASLPPTPAPAPPRPAAAPRSRSSGDAVGIGGTERKVLAILIQYPDGKTKDEIAALAGYSKKASTVGVALSKLRAAGYVTTDGTPRATADGIAAMPDVPTLPSGPELLEYWRSKLGGTERKVLDVILAHNPRSKDEIADLAEYSRTASTVGVALSKLRGFGLVDGVGLAPAFEEAIR